MNNSNQIIERTYVEYSPNYLHAGAQKWQIPVEIIREGDTTTVTLTEEDIEAINGRVARYFNKIATAVYQKYLRGIAASSITWKKHDIRDDDGRESLHSVKMEWNGWQYLIPRFDIERTLGAYTARHLRFTEDEMIFNLGYNRTKEVRLPLSRFPELKALPLEERRHGTNHKHGTVLYFYKIKAKLVVRNAVVDGKGLELHPPGMSEPEFLYGINSR